MVNTLLTELDGLSPRKQVHVIGATNRPDIIDPAMVRPGRLDKLLFVDLPSRAERLDILRAQVVKTPLDGDVKLESIANHSKAEGLSGADLGQLVREAAMFALRETLSSSAADEAKDSNKVVSARHFAQALAKITPSVSASQRRRYELLQRKFAAQPFGRQRAEEDEDPPR